MTPQEALWLFKEELKVGKCSDDCLQCNSMEMAIEALKKQIPTKVKEYRKDGYYCTVCKAIVYPKSHYCEYCGQAIDWSDTE